MTKFLDGPAAGVTLMIRRAPLLLRVVQSAAGEWDALDQLDDAPAPDETVHVYQLIGPPGTVHLDVRDKQGRRRGEWYKTGEYRLLVEQPADEHVRSNKAWQAWAEAWGHAWVKAGRWA